MGKSAASEDDVDGWEVAAVWISVSATTVHEDVLTWLDAGWGCGWSRIRHIGPTRSIASLHKPHDARFCSCLCPPCHPQCRHRVAPRLFLPTSPATRRYGIATADEIASPWPRRRWRRPTMPTRGTRRWSEHRHCLPACRAMTALNVAKLVFGSARHSDYHHHGICTCKHCSFVRRGCAAAERYKARKPPRRCAAPPS